MKPAAATAKPTPAPVRPAPAVTKPPEGVADGMNAPVPVGAGVVKKPVLVGTKPVPGWVMAGMAVVTGTMLTSSLVPVVKPTWGTVMVALMIWVVLEFSMVEPFSSVQGTTVVTTAVTVVTWDTTWVAVAVR